jgi:hypothetical protein
LTTREQIRAVLTSDEFTPGEKFVVEAQFRHKTPISNFKEKLWELLCASDDDNLARLAVAFPEETAGFVAWNRGNLGDRIRAAGCEI